MKIKKVTHIIGSSWYVTFLPDFQWQFFFYWFFDCSFFGLCPLSRWKFPLFFEKCTIFYYNFEVVFFLFSPLYYGPYFHWKQTMILGFILSKKTPKNEDFLAYIIVYFGDKNRILWSKIHYNIPDWYWVFGLYYSVFWGQKSRIFCLKTHCNIGQICWF